MIEQRMAVVAEARSWIGTPYRHMGRFKGVGADCATLLAEVYHAAGLIEPITLDYYPRDWHLHRDDERYLGFVTDRAHPVETGLPGDVVVYRIGRAFAHGAIVIDWPEIVHAHWECGMVILDRGDGGRLADRPRRFYSLWSD